MATAKQRAWRAKFAQLYGNKRKGRITAKRGVKMARRRGKGRSSGGFGRMGGLLSTKNIAGTLGGAYIAPMVGLSPSIGGAVGSYLIGKKGIMGAAVGYFVAPRVLTAVSGMTCGKTAGTSGTVFY